ncbi:hypothetical protein [Pandoraea cepalis]|uniref:hypothetical protein n=1 Tax=Pandoraea cepalis TaxID=2508294 RepID=UPI00263AEA72|nr:hypothetical protein [Pandoraea cepalis]
MYEIWVVEEDGKRVLVRDDVVDPTHANALVEMGNHGAGLRGEGHRYEAVPVHRTARIESIEQE